MKTKNFDKKLTLNKKTIAHLGHREMNSLQAGGSVKPQICVIGAFTDDDDTCIVVTCPSKTLTDNDNTCPVTACLSGIWCA
jgi:hypothetical protein